MIVNHFIYPIYTSFIFINEIYIYIYSYIYAKVLLLFYIFIVMINYNNYKLYLYCIFHTRNADQCALQ